MPLLFKLSLLFVSIFYLQAIDSPHNFDGAPITFLYEKSWTHLYMLPFSFSFLYYILIPTMSLLKYWAKTQSCILVFIIYSPRYHLRMWYMHVWHWNTACYGIQWYIKTLTLRYNTHWHNLHSVCNCNKIQIAFRFFLLARKLARFVSLVINSQLSYFLLLLLLLLSFIALYIYNIGVYYIAICMYSHV